MSAAHMQNEATEVGWGGLESLGLSQKELVLAEALQMEYDALSRLKQDKSETETVHIPSCSSNASPSGEGSQPGSALRGGSVLGSLSGSSPTPSLLGGSDWTPSLPPRVGPPRGDHTKQSLFILDGPEPKVQDSSTGDPVGSGSGFPPKCLNPLSDESPPAIPPRIPISQPPRPENPFLLPQESPVSHNVNLFLPDVDQPKTMSGEVNYDSINHSLMRLNSPQGSRGGPSKGETSGKPVARSRTLPPQVPPRTRVPVVKRNKNSQDLVRAPPFTCSSS